MVVHKLDRLLKIYRRPVCETCSCIKCKHWTYNGCDEDGYDKNACIRCQEDEWDTSMFYQCDDFEPLE